MRIGLNDIDSQVAQAVEERLCAPVNEFLKEDIHWGGFIPFNWKFHAGSLTFKRKREPSDDERRAYELRKKREELVAGRGAAAGLIPPAVGLAVGGVMATASPTAGIVSGLLIWVGGTVTGIRWTLRATPKQRLEKEISQEEMKAVFPLLTLNRAERIYCDTLLFLARTEAGAEAETAMRETLRQLSVLLDRSRQLETRRKSLLPVLGTNSIKELEAEYGDLGRRLDAATDPVTRQSLQQSLQMCANRLENAKACEQGLERLKVQEEAIMQTLSSAQSSLARMHIVSEPQSALAAQEIAETVAQMNQQSYAVEKAIEEVMTLRVQ